MAELRKIFVDICRGFSTTKYRGETLFIKHLGNKDQIDVDEYYNATYEEAVAEGVFTEKQILDNCREDGSWSDKKQREIDDQLLYIESLRNSKKFIKVPSQLAWQDQQIKDNEKKYTELVAARDSLTRDSAEKYAAQKSNDYYIYKSLYKDEKLERPYFEEDEIGGMQDEDVQDLVSVYNGSISVITDRIIKEICLLDFFQSYFCISKSVTDFFGRPGWLLTFLQIKLANYGELYKNIIENTNMSTIPDKIKKDPELLLDYVQAGNNARQELDKNDAQITSIVGAKRSDYVSAGEKGGGKDLFAEAAKAGGKLDKDAIMKLIGG